MSDSTANILKRLGKFKKPDEASASNQVLIAILEKPIPTKEFLNAFEPEFDEKNLHDQELKKWFNNNTETIPCAIIIDVQNSSSMVTLGYSKELGIDLNDENVKGKVTAKKLLDTVNYFEMKIKTPKLSRKRVPGISSIFDEFSKKHEGIRYSILSNCSIEKECVTKQCNKCPIITKSDFSGEFTV